MKTGPIAEGAELWKTDEQNHGHEDRPVEARILQTRNRFKRNKGGSLPNPAPHPGPLPLGEGEAACLAKGKKRGRLRCALEWEREKKRASRI
jgi:hypothetical protein